MAAAIVAADQAVESDPHLDAPALADLVNDIAADGHGLIMLMGKGGVGKTTLAAAIAVELAQRGLPVHLTTSDPAAHLAETLWTARTRSDGQPHRSAGGNRALPQAGSGHQRRASSTSRDASCSKRICARPAPRKSRCSRLSRASSARPGRKFVVMDTAPDRPHPAAARRHRCLPPRHGAPDGRQGYALHHADDAVAGPEADQGDHRHAGRNHSGAGSGQPAGRPAPRRHRALGLDHQQQRGRRASTCAASV
jgi:hypothetical protein